MRRGVVLIPIVELRAHEKVCPQRLAVIKGLIKRSGRINNPVIVDRKTLIILDGHHRVESLRQLNCRLVPAMMVDYFSDQVRVVSRRVEFKAEDLKTKVIETVLAGKLMPDRSTKHLIKNRILGVKIKLNQLK